MVSVITPDILVLLVEAMMAVVAFVRVCGVIVVVFHFNG